MVEDKVTVQWLNLVHLSPKFVIRVGSQDDKASVQTPEKIPNGDGEYWVAGTTFLKCGKEVESVFRVNTDAGGALMGVYWRIANNWWNFQDRPCVFDALGVGESEAFPFDWSCSVPMELDIYHN